MFYSDKVVVGTFQTARWPNIHRSITVGSSLFARHALCEAAVKTSSAFAISRSQAFQLTFFLGPPRQMPFDYSKEQEI